VTTGIGGQSKFFGVLACEALFLVSRNLPQQKVLQCATLSGPAVQNLQLCKHLENWSSLISVKALLTSSSSEAVTP
jgi:hypothetical protein